MKLVIDELVEDALRELADEPYQRVVWLASGGPEISSFVECVSRLLDDSGLGRALDSGEHVYNAEIDGQFRDLARLLVHIDGLRSPDDILEDPLLERARSIAVALLSTLRTFGSEQSS